MPETDQLTADQATPTEEGKAADSGGKDPVVAGLTSRLNKEIEAKKASETRLAEALAKLEGEEERGTKLARLEKENAAYKTALKYPDVAPILQKGFEKGAISPEHVDDDFVAAIRAASGKTPPAEEETAGTPHNPIRQTQGQSPMEQLKQLTSLWPDES